MRFLYILPALCALVLLAAPVASADDTALYDKLLKEKAPAVVSVKFVMNIKIMRKKNILKPENSGRISSSD